VITVETERLLLREHAANDLDAFCAMEMDPDVRRFAGGRPRTREDAEQRFHKLRADDRLPFFAIVYKAEGKYIGRGGLHPMPGGAPGIGFYIARPYWGRGFATEAARAFIEYGFRELKLPKIISSVEVGNGASARVLEKLGFTIVRREEGERRSFDHFELTAGQASPGRYSRY
jgi:ribosomal-protein-alanine N-acetyltransferase